MFFLKNHIPIWYHKNKTKLVLLKYHDSYIINTMYDKIKNFKKKYEEFSSQSLCSRREGDFFEDEEDCENFLEHFIKTFTF